VIAAGAGVEPDEIEFYGSYKAKVNLSALDRRASIADGKLVCVTAIPPPRAGEG
jgi:formyltetrahydrofolate synthetase